MNLNDILAQQQANLNAAVQSSQQFLFGIAAVYLTVFIVFCWVVYMFYSRLSDIAGELRKFRIAYELAQDTAAKVRSRASRTPPNPAVPLAERTDSKYMPKR